MSDASSLPRRDFLKLFAAGTVTAAAAGCRGDGRELAPLLIPERELPTGEAFWSRGLCRQCDAGCGVLVKRMAAVVPLTIDGQPFRQSRLVAKKLEGNPDHPLNAGGLCARGQAGLELTYHPLRLSTPLRRVATRGGGLFKPTTWTDALAELQRKLAAAGTGGVAWVGRPLRGTEAEVVGGWLSQHGARWWEYRAFPSPRAEVDAARLAALPQADFVLSFGNFLESWPGQAALTRAYARFRRERRGALVQVEPRLSLTAANADRWIPVRPGSEGTFALGVAAELMRLRAGAAGSAPAPAWLRDYTPTAVARACDVSTAHVVETARALASARQPLVVGGPNAYAYPHAEFQAGAIAYLAGLAGAAAAAGAGEEVRSSRVMGPAPGDGAASPVPVTFEAPLPPAPRLLIVHEANPVFSAPPGWRLAEWLKTIPDIVVLGTLPDETVLQADLVLPLSTTLESWADDERRLTTGELVATLNPPAMRPLHDTRSLIGVLAALAGEPAPAALDVGASAGPATAPEGAIVRHWQRLQAAHAPGEAFPAFWQAAVERGGSWPDAVAGAAAGVRPARTDALVPAPGASRPAPPVEGLALASALAADPEYPLHLRIYESPIWGDGAGSWLSWLQELPDTTTSAMWSSWVEVHPRLAARLGVTQGDGVWVESRAGRIELPVFLYPGLHPETVAIPAGQGHSAPGASTNRGANAYALLTGERDPQTGAPAWEATRVRLTPSGRRPPLPLFGRSYQKPITHR